MLNLHKNPKLESRRSATAFSLIELLVVMGIIGILAAVAVPAMRGIGRANSITGANRQLLDDIAFARLHSLNARTTVYMVFVPTNLIARFSGEADPRELRQLTNLIGGQLTSYALLSKRTVGDQPGRDNPHYLTEWKFLPEGTVFPPFKYASAQTNEYLRQWDYALLPFPNSTSKRFLLPCIAFNAQGQLAAQRDELLPIAQGSIFFPRDDNGRAQILPVPDVVFTPPNNYTNNYLRINWLTGRVSLDRATVSVFP